MNIFSWSVSASYFTFNNYAYTDYLEYPLLLIQQLLLVSMYLKLNKLSSNLGVSALIIAYLGILYQATLGPSWFLVTLIVSTQKLSGLPQQISYSNIMKNRKLRKTRETLLTFLRTYRKANQGIQNDQYDPLQQKIGE